MLIPYYLNCYSFKINFVVEAVGLIPSTLFFFFKNIFTITEHLIFHMNFRISLLRKSYLGFLIIYSFYINIYINCEYDNFIFFFTFSIVFIYFSLLVALARMGIAMFSRSSDTRHLCSDFKRNTSDIAQGRIIFSQFKPIVLELQCASELSGAITAITGWWAHPPHFPFSRSGMGNSWEFAFLRSFQVILMLLCWEYVEWITSYT